MKDKETIDEKGLTAKQELFCQEYMLDLNATQAYKRAGYTAINDNVAGVQGHKLLRDAKIHARVKELMDERSQVLLIDAYFVVEQLKEINQRCMSKVTPVLEWDAVAKEMVHKQDDAGKKVYEFDSSGANKSAELIGKHLGIFEKDNRRTLETSIQVLEVTPINTPLPQINSEKDIQID